MYIGERCLFLDGLVSYTLSWKKLEDDAFSSMNWYLITSHGKGSSDVTLSAPSKIIQRKTKVLVQNMFCVTNGRKSNLSFFMLKCAFNRRLSSKEQHNSEKNVSSWQGVVCLIVIVDPSTLTFELSYPSRDWNAKSRACSCSKSVTKGMYATQSCAVAARCSPPPPEPAAAADDDHHQGNDDKS